MQATSQDPDTARLMGINVDRIIVVAFALGAAFAAVAGVAYGLEYSNIDFRMGFLAGLKAFTAAVLGGIGNINGAVVGGLVLGLIEAMVTRTSPARSAAPRGRTSGRSCTLILAPVFRPQGRPGSGWWTAHDHNSTGDNPGAATTVGPNRALGRNCRRRRSCSFCILALGLLVQGARRHDSRRLSIALAVLRRGARRARRGAHHLLTADQAARQDKGRLGAWCEVGCDRRPGLHRDHHREHRR